MLLGSACACGRVFLPPRERCISCSSSTYPTEFSGEGTILTYTVLNVVPEGFEPPLILGMIQLDGVGKISGGPSNAPDEETTAERAKGIIDPTPPTIICEGRIPEEELEIGLKVTVEKIGEKYFFK